MRQRFKLLVLLVVLGLSFPALAQDGKLSPELETRAQHLFTELRCVVCQNQSIASSEADVAKDLRQIVREQIEAGKSDDTIRSFLVERYGEYILLKPRLHWYTVLLWGTPLIVLLLGGVLIFYRFRSSASGAEPAGAAELSSAEKAELEQILRDQSKD